MTHIKRVFIANRGEIARRIALGAQSQGIDSVALYSGEAPPAFLEGLVQQFVKVEEESPALYLNAELMVQLAVQTSCDAVHPGFGFLSENARFASLVREAGLNWIGPSPSAISEMASKAAAREIAQQQSVPVVPGIERLQILEDGSHLAVVRAFAKQHGFPILLKAALGGGGKGMRVVQQESELEEAIRRAQSEAINAFGDGALIVERYVEHPRHVEVQILGDKHGNIYALSDRDCSVQRRHQKIIEEAPAPGLSPITRQRMHEAAVRLAQSVRYESAGTVEFLVDWSPDKQRLEDQNFYFLEMNTRLQVEHPVTEQVLNEDLVAWQFRIAQGESIRDKVHLKPQGHSIELRLYAEDAAQKFLPAPGPVHGFLPYQAPGIRWEIGIDPIDAVSTRFDPMIAKLIATGADRKQAIERLKQALKQTVLAIPTSNLSFLLAVLSHPGFVEAQPTTRFLETYQVDLAEWTETERARLKETAHTLVKKLHEHAQPATHHDQAHAPSVAQLTQAIFSKKTTTPQTNALLSLAQVKIVSVPSRFRSLSSVVGRGLLLEATQHHAFAFCQCRRGSSHIRWINLDGQCFYEEDKGDELQAASKSAAHSHTITAPVPGKVVKVLIQAKDQVKERQTVLILESMKMEFEVQAARSGTVGAILVEPGQQVQADEVLAQWIEESSKT